MEATIAQASLNNGASSATDFQPPTRNPQNNTSGVQQQTGLEGISNPQEFLDNNKSIELSVAADPAPSAPQSNVNNTNTIFVVIILVFVAGIFLFKILRKPTPKTTEDSKELADSKASKEIATEKIKKKPVNKSKAKRSKRRNR